MARFADVFEDVTKQGTKIPTNRYLEKGAHPIIDQGQSEIAGYTNETDGLFTNVPAIIFGDHTRIIKYVDTPCFLGADGVKLLKAKDHKANYKYLYYALCNADIPNTGYNRHFKWLKEIEIPDYLEKEQNEIADQLEQIDFVTALRKQQLAKLDELVKSRFVELFGDLMENSHGWPIKKISDISLLLKSGLSRKLLSEDIGLPMIRSCNIQNGQFVYDDIKYWYVDDPQGAKTSDYVLDDGDILINFINSMSQIGKTAIFHDVGRECIYTTNIFRMKLAPNCNRYFYNWFAMTEYYYRQLQNIIQPAVNQASFTTVNFLNLSIPVPPLEIQEQFAAFVEQTDKSKLAIQQSLEKLETLKKALMQKYFG